ncbi:MAG: hypothetical protein ABJP45_05170 [Cyclobacteriaceae bacterium]
MKKILFCCFICFSLISTSQTRFDFFVGTTISSLSEDLMVDYGFEQFREDYIDAGGSTTSDAKNSVRLGIYLAAEADFSIGEKSFVKTGLKYVTTGDSYFFKTDDVVLQSSSGSESDEKFKLRPRLDYLAIPVNYGINVSDVISIYGGVTPSLNINNVIRTNRFEEDGDDLKQKWDSNDNPVAETSLVTFLNAGISYYLGEGSGTAMVFDLRFSQALNNVYDDSNFSNTTAKFNDTKLWSLELGIGIALR